MGGFTSLLAAAGIGLQVYGQYRAGQDAAAAAAYNAAIFQQEAAVVETKKGLTEAQYNRLIRKLEGETVTAVAASGYDLSGSFLEVMNDSLTQANLDKQTELYNLEVEKAFKRSAAEEATRAGRRYVRTANVQAASTLLTQGNEWYQKYGGFGKKDT